MSTKRNLFFMLLLFVGILTFASAQVQAGDKPLPAHEDSAALPDFPVLPLTGTFPAAAATRNIESLSSSGAYNVTLLGQIAGATYASVVVGDYAYTGVGPRLVILDISLPAAPTVVGHTAVLPGMVEDVAVAGGYAYVANDTAGMRVIDVSNPAAPHEVGSVQTAGFAHDVAVAGNYAYIADGDDGLRVIDVSDPTAPTQIAYYDPPTSSPTLGVAVAGNYAYVTKSWDGVHVLDISNPSAPTPVGYYDPPGKSWDVAVRNKYAYVAGEGALRVVDVSDPSNPVSAGYLSLHDAQGVAIAADYAYVADLLYGFVVVDISVPTAPAQVASLNTPGQAYDVASLGGYAYVSDERGGLRIVDVTSPDTPVEVGAYDLPDYALDSVVSGNYAFVAALFDGLRVLDISNPAAPVEIGSYQTIGYAWNVAISGNYAYVVGGSILSVIDVSDPSTPVQASYLYLGGTGRGIAVSGNYAYVADCGDERLYVIDVADPAAPAEVGSVGLLGYATGVAVAGNFAYIAAGDGGYGGLRMIDVADPTSPVVVGAFDARDARDVAIAGNYAYLATYIYGLRVIDISDPAHPVEVGSIYPSDGASGVKIVGSIAYVAAQDAGLRVIDVSSPATPVEIGFHDTAGEAFGVTVADGSIYVAADGGGLYILALNVDPPSADFESTPTSGVAPLDVSFTNLTTGHFSTVLWNFGDGSVSTDEDPQHTYVTPGSYSVSLTVSGVTGTDTLTRTNYIDVYQPVIANFTAAPLTGTVPLTVTFANLSSGNYETCLWDFGDESTSQTCEDPSHVYSTPGAYDVTLSLTGPNDSDTLVRDNYVHVYTPPVAAFSAFPTTGTPPLDVQFTNLSAGDFDTCLWDFGDGGTSSECENPTYTYTTIGTYSVSLTASGLGGNDTISEPGYITIEDHQICLPIVLKP